MACPACGPEISFTTAEGGNRAGGTDSAIAATQAALAAAQVVAVKGLGGYHLACDATSAAAVAKLRARKGRADKPFAVMVPDVTTAELLVDLRADEVSRVDRDMPAHRVDGQPGREPPLRPGGTGQPVRRCAPALHTVAPSAFPSCSRLSRPGPPNAGDDQR